MISRMALAFLSGCVVAGMLALACLHWTLGNSTPVRFENRSGVALRGVTISGSGFAASLGDVGPGETVRARIHPAGESAIRVGFRANGKSFSAPHDVYFEAGGDYDVDVTVDPGLGVIVSIEAYSLRSVLLP